MAVWRGATRSMTRSLICFALVAAGCACAQTCPALTDEARSRVSAYVADRYEFAPDLKMEDEGTVVGSCFRRIGIRANAPSRSLELFLSPDQRFLFETLLDTNISPSAERLRVARETQLALLAGSSPYLGPENAPVTLVEFSDFQCPFCKRFADLLSRLPAKDRLRLRVVFKQRPLAMHQWARRAALASICASFESSGAFWVSRNSCSQTRKLLRRPIWRTELPRSRKSRESSTSTGCMGVSRKRAPKPYFCGMRS